MATGWTAELDKKEHKNWVMVGCALNITKKWNHTINPKANEGLVPVTHFQPSSAFTSPMYLCRSLFQMCHLYYMEEGAGAPPQVSATKDLLEQQ